MEQEETTRYYRRSLKICYTFAILLQFSWCPCFDAFENREPQRFNPGNRQSRQLYSNANNPNERIFPIGWSRFGNSRGGSSVENGMDKVQSLVTHPKIGKNHTSVLGTGVVKTPHREMRGHRISFGKTSDGYIAMSELVVMTKSSLAERLRCPLRDLRIIDHVCHRSGPAFLSRKNCIIVHVGHLRCVIEQDSLLVFLPPVRPQGQANIHTFTATSVNTEEYDIAQEVSLLNDLVDAIVIHLNAVFGPGNSSEIYSDKSGADPRAFPLSGPNQLFELVVLEVLLGHISLYERVKARNLVSVTNELLNAITASQSQSSKQNNENGGGLLIKIKKDSFMELQARLGTLLQLKNQIDQLEATCSDIAAAFTEVLRNDDDMMAMLLSKSCDDPQSKENKRRNRSKSLQHDKSSEGEISVDEVELLFEDYLLQIDETISSLRTVQSNVRNTEEVVDIELDLVRNRIMKFELLLEMTSLAVGCGALVSFTNLTYSMTFQKKSC